jgi:hypothetical protein
MTLKSSVSTDLGRNRDGAFSPKDRDWVDKGRWFLARVPCAVKSARPGRYVPPVRGHGWNGDRSGLG